MMDCTFSLSSPLMPAFVAFRDITDRDKDDDDDDDDEEDISLPFLESLNLQSDPCLKSKD
jgi:hypothetical protein